MLQESMQFLAALIAEHLIGRSDDVVPRTLLGWTRAGLLTGLIMQTAYLIHESLAWSVPTLLWVGILANVAALVVVRHVARWRYPI
jgi:hypothetical protein